MPDAIRRRVFLDSSVIIAAVRGDRAASTQAGVVVSATDVDFVSNSAVVLETVAQMKAHGFQKQLSLAERILDGVTVWVEVDERLLREARTLVESGPPGIGAMDAILLASAKLAEAEFVTAEAPSRAIFGVSGVTVRSLLARA